MTGHPWISFYTERMLKTLPIKSKVRLHFGGASTPMSATAGRLQLDSNRRGDTPTEDASPVSSLESLPKDLGEQDDSGLVDALAVAISHVRISEPKRSRLCGHGPSSPIREQHSSNMKAGSLCKAF